MPNALAFIRAPTICGLCLPPAICLGYLAVMDLSLTTAAKPKFTHFKLVRAVQ